MTSLERLVAYARSPAARPLRFIVVGGVATLTHLAVATTLILTIPTILPYLANLCAFTVAVVVSYLGHRHITFATRGSMLKFSAVSIGGFALNNMILAAGLHWQFPPIAAVAIATLCVPVLTYIASALWAFKPAS